MATTIGDNDLLALNEALERLEGEDAEVAKLVKLRYFIGFTLHQCAQALGISERTAYRHWAYARARLHEELREMSD